MEHFQPNPFIIGPILDHLFQFIDGKSLQECRLVCSTWNDLCKHYFIKKSTLKITEENVEKLDQTFLSEAGANVSWLFPTIHTVRHPVIFTSFNFDVSILDKRGSERKNLFLKNKSRIRHLCINNNQRPTRLFSGTDKGIIDSLIGSKLKRLTLTGNLKVEQSSRITGVTPLTISLSKLAMVRSLDFNNCAIVFVLDSGRTIDDLTFKTKEFSLVDCFVREGFLERPDYLIRCEPLRYLNTVIDFSRIQKLNIIRSRPFCYPHVELHFRDIPQVKFITLVGIVIHIDGIISPEELTLSDNGYECSKKSISLLNYINESQIKKLDLSGDRINLKLKKYFKIDKLRVKGENFVEIICPLTECREFRPRMHTRVLKIDKSVGILDNAYYLRMLPKGIEQLDMTCPILEIISDNERPRFPNLQSLLLRYEGGNVRLADFANSPKLVDLAIKCANCGLSDTFVNECFVIGIKRLLFLDNHPIVFPASTECPLHLDILAFGNSRLWQDLDCTAFEAFQASLVVFCDYDYDNSKLEHIGEHQVNNIFNLKKKILADVAVAFGPVKWGDENNLQHTHLANVFDQSGEYYIYSGETATVILETQFTQMIPLYGGNSQWYQATPLPCG